MRQDKKFLSGRINEGQAVEDWRESVETLTKVKDARRSEYTSVLCEAKRIRERNEAIIKNRKMGINEDGYGSTIPSQIGGVGAVEMPGVGRNTASFYDTTIKQGSGDIPSPTLGLQMRIGMYTIGFDLLPLIPMEMPSMMFSFMDTVYAGGTIDSTEDVPLYVTFDGGKIGTSNWSMTDFPKGTEIVIAGDNTSDALQDGVAMRARVMKYGRYNGELIVKPLGFVTMTASTGVLAPATDKSIRDVITTHDRHAILLSPSATTSTLGSIVHMGAKLRASMTSTTDNNIHEASNRDGITSTPMSRAEGEKGTTNSITLKRYSTAIEAQSYKIEASTTLEDEQDLAAQGYDANAQLYKAAETQIQQSINGHIIDTMFRLGVTTHAALHAAQGANLNMFVGPATTASKALTDFSLSEFKDINGVDRKAEFGDIKNMETNSSAENHATRQRNISSKILAAKNIIGLASRRGRGTFAVVSAQIATALEDVKNYVPAPIEANINSDGTNMYYAGKLSGLDIYVHEELGWNDMRILVGRRGTEVDAGLKMFAYDLAHSVNTIAEGTMSEKVLISSRYALVPVGYNPEANYITLALHNDFGEFV